MKKIRVTDPRHDHMEVEVLLIQDGSDIVVAIPGDSFSVRLLNGICREEDFRNLSGTYAQEFKTIVEREIE